jgi:serine/threonine protein kinase
MKKNFQGVRGGSFDVLGKLGNGANGDTYRATSRKNKKTVVIKMPKLEGVKALDLDERILKINHSLEVETRVLSKLSGVKGIAQLIDHGLTPFNPKKAVHFNVYEFIAGKTLTEWAELYAKFNGKQKFEGIREPSLWLKLATNLTSLLSDVHSRKVVHGDIWHENIMVKGVQSKSFIPANHTDLVLIDFGWGIVLDQRASLRADRSVWFPHWAPERVKHDDSNPRWYSPVDIYSLGNTLLFLAAGESKVIPFLPHLVTELTNRRGAPAYKIQNSHGHHIFKPESEIKAFIANLIAKNNPQLFESFPAITEIIMFCMRPEVSRRAKHAGTIERQLAALAPASAGKQYFRVAALKNSADKFNAILKRSYKKSLHPMLLRLVLNDLDKMAHGLGQSQTVLLERQGERDDLILDITSCIGEARKGDCIRGVLALRLLHTQNLGSTGRFIASLATAAQSGVPVELVILKSPDDPPDEYQALINEFFRRQIETSRKGGKLKIKVFAIKNITTHLHWSMVAFCLLRPKTA